MPTRKKTLKEQVRELTYTTNDVRELQEIQEIVTTAIKARFPMAAKTSAGAGKGVQTRRGRNTGVSQAQSGGKNASSATQTQQAGASDVEAKGQAGG